MLSRLHVGSPRSYGDGRAFRHARPSRLYYICRRIILKRE
ncbi:hypothetical protein COLSTE_01924 [Collinsella stercoris DSM 13279]|uniref:Uncharacterized protein n=1 Tax=Collinsella stercoris DSM 13279 TaxID=445975 RepID=B6GCU8_9ACTN|nr:hypothetical protein COLSTE_01924 [Collinsella stercoris DSM 13279]